MPIFHCYKCKSSGILGHHLKKTLKDDLYDKFTANAKASEQQAKVKKCFCCHTAYKVIYFEGSSSKIYLDFCTKCAILWFDAGESKEVPMNTKADFTRDDSGLEVSVQEGWSHDAMEDTLLGLVQVHHDGPTLQKQKYDFPLLTLAMTFIFFLFIKSKSTLAFFAYLPHSGALRELLTLPMHGFVHADLRHVLGNAFFLLLFGSQVERYIGRSYVISLFLLGTVLSGLAYRFSGMSLPLVGSSAGVFALMGTFLREFPKAKLGFRRNLLLFRGMTRLNFDIRIPAYLYILGYVIFNLILLPTQFHGSGIHHLGHLVGFLAGYFIAL